MFNFVTLIIIISGAINWFAIGVFQFDLIAGIFGTQSHFFSRFVYTVIGLAGFWMLLITIIKHGQLSLLPPRKKKGKNKDNMGDEAQSQNQVDDTQLVNNTNDNNEQNTATSTDDPSLEYENDSKESKKQNKEQNKKQNKKLKT